ncbi:exodeoxyribonuclease VII small subunit [Pseudobutyrivibrio sp.]|uniref:Exodeoxyribonuclease 7 small subunit n=1 Tax=Pseudobutyrivibrio ruminis TaxID=46206 RepID=A0A927YQC2_9FIRM|nr:exodeoxyribonuclease VII small subunit [Pseudobutyrivibrio sp.]MBE5919338.1 exodeoxyribonuclease VII small subunit [Pseudobutyrivibrio ruminis]MBP3727399.1 exodeoxyribonuclease VII small subunit [Pseudobutyrivibrio sp.]MBQ6463572.1 exodeoxyribonuclease VII small subunit [Pseudobutyrivibrio sp.]MBQ8489387.1 exodeoxyribonuclease VII small subunit [Pseudobutyrivibrio sp.]
MEENNTKTIEESFEALEEIITKLESSDISLDESFALYKNGMEELKQANDKIEQTKKAVMAISKDGGLEVFEEEE